MTLAQLRYLLAIIDSGLNITLAAARVNATQPALSKQLRQFEDELGIALFVRHGHNLAGLTPAGEEIVERARIVAAEAENIRAVAANHRGDRGGSLRIATTALDIQFVLPPMLAALRHIFPDVDVKIFKNGTSHAPDLDVCIFSTDGSAPPGDIAIPLYRWSVAALVPRGHPLAAIGRPIRFADLARYPLVAYDDVKAPPLALARRFLDAGFTPRFAYTVPDGQAIRHAVSNGAGVGLLAEMGAFGPEENGLLSLPLPDLFPSCTSWATLRRDRVLRGHVLHLLALLSGLGNRQLQRIVAGDEAPPPAANAIAWPLRRLLLDDRATQLPPRRATARHMPIPAFHPA